MNARPVNRVLIYGAEGGREHALFEHFAASPSVEEIFWATVSLGPEGHRKFRRLTKFKNASDAANFAAATGITLVVVASEGPIVGGETLAFRRLGISVFAPTPAASMQTEGSKRLAKRRMLECGVPTAPAKFFSSSTAARAYAEDQFTNHGIKKLVVKADGLCGGKGVTICNSFEDASRWICAFMDQEVLGEGGRHVLIEDFLEGDPSLPRAELSITVLVDQRGNFILLPEAQDYKAVFDGDKGFNTGGMGSISPVPWFREERRDRVVRTIVEPIIRHLDLYGTPYSGVLYVGIMWTTDGPKVLEFNARLGDPETQVVLTRIKGDLFTVFRTVSEGGNVNAVRHYFQFSQQASVCVVVCRDGYPEWPPPSIPIPERLLHSDPDEHPGVYVYHAGTMEGSGGIPHSRGGRILGVTALGENIAAARRKVYDFLGKTPNGYHWRTDIGDGY